MYQPTVHKARHTEWPAGVQWLTWLNIRHHCCKHSRSCSSLFAFWPSSVLGRRNVLAVRTPGLLLKSFNLSLMTARRITVHWDIQNCLGRPVPYIVITGGVMTSILVEEQKPRTTMNSTTVKKGISVYGSRLSTIDRRNKIILLQHACQSFYYYICQPKQRSLEDINY